MKKNIKWIFCILCLIIFCVLGFLVLTNNELKFDTIVYEFISKYINTNTTYIVKFITNLGSAFAVITITFSTLIVLKNKKIGTFMAVDLALITIFQYILKPIFGRIRPVEINLIEESNYSFPSGHSLTAMAFYGFIIYLIYKSNLKYKKIYIILLSIVILLIGLSRVYLGVHFITDVLGGFTFALFYLTIFIHSVKKYLYK